MSDRRFWALLLLSVCMAGCDSAGKSAGQKYRIAVIPKGTTHEFWRAVHAGAENAARELGNVTVSWKGPQQENDREGQINVTQDFITQRMDGICLAPLDSQGLVAVVSEAKQEGIPTVIFDSGLAKEDDIVSYVATDNFASGAMAARHMGKLLEGKGDVIVLRYTQGSESTEQREEGFLQTLAKEFPDVKILDSNTYSGTTPERAQEVSQDLLLKFHDDVDGIFSVCEPNATGMLSAIEAAGLAGKVKFIAFDPNQRLIQGMDQGSVHGIVLQDPVTMGYLAVKTMVAHLEKKPVERRIKTGEFIATPENRNEPRMKKLLVPEQFGQ